jgi:hypothetical protein
MCSFKFLHQTTEGCVLQCAQCEGIKVVFGTVSIALTQPQFYEFIEVITTYYDENKLQPENLRCIYIPTTAKAIHLLFNIKELKSLMQILDEAYLTLSVNKLVQNSCL